MSDKRYLGNIITDTPTAPSSDFANSAAKGVWSLAEQLAYQKAGLWPVPGKFAVDIDDVFSTYLYTGTGSAQTITNGIDLAGEGGLTWIKTRNTSTSAWHSLSDTERGAGYILRSDLTNAQTGQDLQEFTSFNSNGFTVGNDDQTNGSGRTYASWTWRKAPKFFTCLTYTGDGNDNRTVSHNLGSSPGMVIVKRTNDADSWVVLHRSASSSNLFLNLTSAASSTLRIKSMDSSTFTLGTNAQVNGNGSTYVAYLFAHNDGDGGFGPDGDADIIKCGSLTVSSQATVSVNLGFEAQWVMLKRSDGTGNWFMFDVVRGMTVDGFEWLYANTTMAAEVKSYQAVYPTSTGFDFNPANNGQLTDGTYIYMAIRRGPLAVPEDATKVFANSKQSKNTTGFPVDMFIYKGVNGSDSHVYSRLTGGTKYLEANNTGAERTSSDYGFDDMEGTKLDGWGTNFIFWNWKRAPGYFDAVAYTGDSTAERALSHNLTVPPEMIWIKNRDQSGYNWIVGMGDPVGWDYYLTLNGSAARAYSNIYFGNTNTAPTASQFYVGRSAGWDDTNRSTYSYIAYLFASVDGVSKVGSFTATGSALNIDCGFTSGARFVLIRRTNSASSDWYVFDSARGITSSTSPYLYLNSTSSESVADYIDPLSSGFTVTTSFFGSGDFIFYAIA